MQPYSGWITAIGISPRPSITLRIYGNYLLETREVWAPRLGNIREVGLAAAPADLAGFADLGNAIVRSSRIASYLKF
jgi:carbonic anhydrase